VGRFPVLAGADFDVEQGEVVLLSGPNGAGKTSVLRCCAGLLAVRSGSVVVLGEDLGRDRRAARRRVAFVGHDTFCYDDLTVAENLRFAARAAGRPALAADDALARVGLDQQAGVTHARLSQGQRRRLALGVALAREAELLLLDEPHAGLDGDGRAVVDTVVRGAVAAGRTVLIASHEVGLARSLASREVHIVGGRVHELRAPAPRPVEVTT
jgi:heme ABC exporter ATP-binding subunit CcmA